MGRRIFSRFFAKMRRENYEIYSMANRHKPETGLTVNVWLDEAKEYIRGGHSKRMKFQVNYANDVQPENFATLTFEGEVIVPNKMKRRYELNARDVKGVKNFMQNNLYALDKLADELIYSSDFDNMMIKGGEPAPKEKIDEQSKKVDAMMAVRKNAAASN